MKLNTTAFAMASGLILGLGLLLMTWFIIALDGASGEITVISRVFRGYNISPVGSLIGLAWGLGTELIVMLVGGVARNQAIAQELGAALDTQLVVPEDPQIVVATGAAVIAGERRALADGPRPQ